MPFDDRSFDAVYTVNTVYFWPDVRAALTEISRVTAPGGRVLLVSDGHDFGARDVTEVARQLGLTVDTLAPTAAAAQASNDSGLGRRGLTTPG